MYSLYTFEELIKVEKNSSMPVFVFILTFLYAILKIITVQKKILEIM